MLVLVIVIVLAVILGFAVAASIKGYLTKENMLKALGAFGLACLAALIVSPIDMAKWIKLVSIGIAAVLGWVLIARSKLSETSVFAWATAFVGAFFLMHGIGQIVGGFPPIAVGGVKEQKFTALF